MRHLLHLALRQDRKAIAPWIALISVLSASSVLVYDWVFPDPQSQQILQLNVTANPAMALIFGKPVDLTTADGFNAWRAGAIGAFFAGLMAIFIVVRNSRAEEDSGRAELVASGVLGREARPAVAVTLAFLAAVLLGVVSAVVTIVFGGGVANSIMLSATFTASAMLFAGVGVIAAQLGSDARSANTLAITVLGALFVVRGYIDSSGAPGWAVWLTPFGWLQETKPAVDNIWWPLVLVLTLAMALAAVGLALHARRDFGMGLVAPRPGPARAGAVGNLWGLALRLHRSALASWMIGFAVLGVLLGFLANTVTDVFAENPGIAQVLASGAVSQEELVAQFLLTMVRILGIYAAVHGVQIVMRLYAEEAEYRTDPLLGGAVSRAAHLASHAVIAFLSTALGMLLAGSVMGWVADSTGDTISFADVVGQSIATVPAVWVLVALAIAVVGATPSKRLAGWMGVVVTFALTLLGPMFNLDEWVLGISPLWHVPNIQAANPAWSGLAWLALVAALLTAVGFAGYRRRDIA
ncbi:MAG: multidrug ABC transporter permease [Intrasporangiaceae bacterium]|nr:multidrug ABC transporter permease [Intrasporangiaceae bacterium]